MNIFPYGSIIDTACTVVNRGNHFVGFVALPTILGRSTYTITFATGSGHENALQSIADIDISTINITNKYRTGFVVDIPYTSSATGTVFKTSFSISA